MRRKPLFPPPNDPKTGKKLRNKGRQDYSVLTVNGRVRLWRRRWHGASVGTLTPLDPLLDAVEASISVGVREMSCRLNGNSKNFDRTAENLARTAQVHVSGETLRVLVENEGRQVLRLQNAGSVPVGWSAVDCKTEQGTSTGGSGEPSAQVTPPPTRVYLGSDGVMVPMVTDVEKKARRAKVKQKRRRRGKKAKPLAAAKAGADQKYKEFKIVAYYDETQEHRLVAGTKGDCNVAGRLMRRQASRIRLDLADEKVGNVDGSPWIRNQTESQCLPLDALGLDFYHLADNVHKARRAIYGEEDAAGKTWAGELLHTFKHEGYEATWERLLSWRSSLRRSQRKAADTLLSYVSERRDMIQYPEFQEKGWQIGSGPTEATCKTLTARLKGSGMRWDPDNAEAVMALEGLMQSNQWQSYWRTQMPTTG
jgi:hypothetical protein